MTGSATPADPDATLTDVLTTMQEAVRSRAGAAAATRGRGVDTYDAEVATLSGHLAAVETVVHPVARKRLPGGHASVAAQLRLARRVELHMRLLEGRLHGDTLAAPMSLGALQAQLTDLVALYCEGELSMARQLDAHLPAEQRRALVGALTSAVRRAPTRPHPYTPHPRGLGRLMFAVCAVWDRAFDVMDNRVVPAMRPPRSVPPLRTWDRYLLGRPGFEQQPARPPRTVDLRAATGPASATGQSSGGTGGAAGQRSAAP
jgi:hypothetical protein